MALGAASYKLAMDAGDVKAGAADAQRAFRLVERGFREMETPAERLQRKLEAAEKAQQSFVEGSKTFEKAAAYVAKLRQEIEALNRTPIEASRMNAYLAGGGKSAAGNIPIVGH